MLLRELKKRHYINITMLLRVIGWLLMIETCFMVIPLVTALLMDIDGCMPFLISIGITGISAAGLMSLRTKNREMGKREAILLTSMTWIILSLYGMLPFLLAGTHFSVTDAFFETISGFTTTGMSVIDSLDNVSPSILIWRCVTQWVGGMGIILFTLAVLPMLNYQGGIMLFNAEVTGITHDKLAPRVSYTAKSLWFIYIVLTVCLVGLLWLSPMSGFEALCYGLSTMSTGGFAISDMSISEWDNTYVKLVMTLFMFIGGMNFSLIYQSVRGHVSALLHNTVFKVYLWWVLGAYALFALNVLRHGLVEDVGDLTVDPLFQAVSLISSTAITEPDIAQWGNMAEIVLIVLIFSGACAGSTSGGAKLDRIVVLCKFLRNEFYKIMHPHAVTTVQINGRGTSYVLVQKVLGFIFVYVLVIIACGMILTALDIPLKASFFYALSAISNAGLGTELSGVDLHYSQICDFGKWVLALVMLVGRLELYTVLLLFTPVFWRR